ncbi:MAG: hypothetical protein ACLRQF_23580 [Thomasclavelia ramosa]
MDLSKHEVFVGDELINLTKVEYDLLQMFIDNKRRGFITSRALDEDLEF